VFVAVGGSVLLWYHSVEAREEGWKFEWFFEVAQGVGPEKNPCDRCCGTDQPEFCHTNLVETAFLSGHGVPRIPGFWREFWLIWLTADFSKVGRGYDTMSSE
jgi:hypothetical protein